MIYNFKKTEQNYSISLLIKIVNESQSVKDEKYYSIPLSFNTKKSETISSIISIILISLGIVLIIISLILFFCIRRREKKNKDKFKTFSFTEEDLPNERLTEKQKDDDEYDNTFV